MIQTEVLVIGGGPAGYAGSIRAAQQGSRVILVEDRDLGGTCLNRGCIPTKALYRAQEVAHLAKRASDFGIRATLEGFDWEKVQARKDKVVKQLTGGVRYLLKKSAVETVEGFASFLDPHTVEVQKRKGGNEHIRFESVIIATGSVSASLPVEGADLPGVIDSDEALELREIPEKLVVIGGGYIGMEMACIYNAFGAQVEIVEMLPHILPTTDHEISSMLVDLLQKKGLNIHTSARVEKIEKKQELVVHYVHEGKKQSVSAPYVLVATGREPYTEGLGLKAAGVKLSGKMVETNAKMRTSVPHIYACGDVNGKYLLAHVAYKEAEVAVHNIAGGDVQMDYRAVPGVIFTVPEVASVGLTEKEAKEKKYEPVVGRFPFRPSGRALLEGETDGLVKIVADRESEEILGAHIIGHHATDLIAELTLAMQIECTPEEVSRTIHAHPTLAEVVMEAAEGVFGNPLHSP